MWMLPLYLHVNRKSDYDMMMMIIELGLIELGLIQSCQLIRSFELQRSVQRSLTLKWDLSWVLICLQKAPYEPLHKASRHGMIKTAFLLALATAKKCSKIYSLAMDSNHLKFNQSDGLVSLTVQTGFWQRISSRPFAKIL